MIEIKKCYFDDLTEDEQYGASNNGYNGKEEANYIRVLHNGETVDLYSDAMEPEDATFNRDLRWIIAALKDAYVLGMQDATSELLEKYEKLKGS